MSEKQIIEGCLQQRKESQRELFRRFAPVLFTVCRQYSQSDSDAEDVLQEAFIRIFDKLGSFRFEGSLQGWMRKIAVQAALKKLKKEDAQFEPLGMNHSFFPDVLGQLHEEDLLRLVRQLPDGYRAVFNLFVFEGYTHKQIAIALDIGESTSRSQLTKARNILKKKIIDSEKVRA